MQYYSTLKVYTGYDPKKQKMKREQYSIKNPETIIGLDLKGGDTLLIDGIGRLEVYSASTEINYGENPYRHLEIVAGRVTV